MPVHHGGQRTAHSVPAPVKSVRASAKQPTSKSTILGKERASQFRDDYTVTFFRQPTYINYLDSHYIYIREWSEQHSTHFPTAKKEHKLKPLRFKMEQACCWSGGSEDLQPPVEGGNLNSDNPVGLRSPRRRRSRPRRWTRRLGHLAAGGGRHGPPRAPRGGPQLHGYCSVWKGLFGVIEFIKEHLKWVDEHKHWGFVCTDFLIALL